MALIEGVEVFSCPNFVRFNNSKCDTVLYKRRRRTPKFEEFLPKISIKWLLFFEPKLVVEVGSLMEVANYVPGNRAEWRENHSDERE